MPITWQTMHKATPTSTISTFGLPMLPKTIANVPSAEKRYRPTLPGSLGEYLAYFKEWRKFWQGGAFAYEYHFWWHLISDLGGTQLARRISEDIKCYKDHAVNGIVEDGTQRPFFPTGLVFYTYARTLFDSSLTPLDIAEDYLSCAFGEDWREFYDYLEEISSLFGVSYLEGRDSSNPEYGDFYNPEKAVQLEDAERIFSKGEELIRSHYNSDYRVRTVSVRILEAHLEFCRGVAEIMIKKARGDDDGAFKLKEELRVRFGKREAAIELYFDHNQYFNRLNTIITRHKTLKSVNERGEVDHTRI